MTNPKKLGYYRTTTLQRAIMMLATDIIGYVLLFPYVIIRRFRGLSFDPEKVLRIAVFRLDGIGDLILSEPALEAIRSSFPKAYIVLFVNKWASGLAEALPGHDKIVSLDAPMFKAFKEKFDWLAVLEERRVMRRLGRLKQYDLAIDLRGDILSIIAAYWIGARWLVSRSSRAGGFLLTNVIRQQDEGKISESELNLNFVEHLTERKFNHKKPTLKLTANSSKQSVIEKFLSKIGSDYVCLAISAPYETRCYPAEKWIEVIRLIQQKYDKPLVILGAEEDFERCDLVARRVQGNIYNMAGRFSLMESTICIAGARMFIGSDGGLIHIASAFNLPVVQLFGPSNSLCFGHFDPKEHVIHKECSHNPCNENFCKNLLNWCMNRITPNEIFETASPYLK